MRAASGEEERWEVRQTREHRRAIVSAGTARFPSRACAAQPRRAEYSGSTRTISSSCSSWGLSSCRVRKPWVSSLLWIPQFLPAMVEVAYMIRRLQPSPVRFDYTISGKGKQAPVGGPACPGARYRGTAQVQNTDSPACPRRASSPYGVFVTISITLALAAASRNSSMSFRLTLP